MFILENRFLLLLAEIPPAALWIPRPPRPPHWKLRPPGWVAKTSVFVGAVRTSGGARFWGHTRSTGCPHRLQGDELEMIRPSVYRNVARQLHISLQSEPVVTDAFLAVAGHIFSAGITWGKVVSLYAVAAGLAVDCVRQAQPAMVHALVDCLGEFVRKTLATWLRRRGGWTDVLKCVVSTDPGLRSHWLVAALCSFGRFLKAAFFVLLPER
ncbi:bcl-2-related ovarian killer protein isoform X2 [Pan troglodytes]|uniref:bcl-2-related ovarian killer protein isoform X2 n=1 Tax=Pan troglodytes TaxID=9598 RepID=UPI0004F0BA4D|nr:bcl-2-related ovarian killer protein isoform X2 [Pan troglodytes]